MSCGVGCRRGSDLALLWLCSWLETEALIRPLTWEIPYAMNVALKRQKKKKNQKYFYRYRRNMNVSVNKYTFQISQNSRDYITMLKKMIVLATIIVHLH